MPLGAADAVDRGALFRVARVSVLTGGVAGPGTDSCGWRHFGTGTYGITSMGYGAGVKTVPVHPLDYITQYQSVTSQNALRATVLGLLPSGTAATPRSIARLLETSAPIADPVGHAERSN